MPPSRGSSQPRDRTQASRIAGAFFTVWATREAHSYCLISHSKIDKWFKNLLWPHFSVRHASIPLCSFAAKIFIYNPSLQFLSSSSLLNLHQSEMYHLQICVEAAPFRLTNSLQCPVVRPHPPRQRTSDTEEKITFSSALHLIWISKNYSYFQCHRSLSPSFWGNLC